MRQPTTLARVAAVASALSLLAVYVYDRAGGNILPKLGTNQTQAAPSGPQPTIDPALGTVVEFPLEVDGSETFFYGSKSGAVLPPGEFDPIIPAPVPGAEGGSTVVPQSTAVPVASQPGAPAPPTQQQVLPSSKLIVPVFGGGSSGTAEPRPPATQPQFLPGPKSDIIPVFGGGAANQPAQSGSQP